MAIPSPNPRSPDKGLSKSDCVQEKLVFHPALQSLLRNQTSDLLPACRWQPCALQDIAISLDYTSGQLTHNSGD